MKAVSMGVAYLNNTAGDRDKFMVIIDNLLPVDGEFKFDDNNVHAYFSGERSLIDSRMDITVQHLLENNIIADLTGVTVIVAGGGNTSLPQEPLSSNQRTLLWTFWEKVFNAANAEEVLRIPGQTGVKSNSTFPVAMLNFPKEEGIGWGDDPRGEDADGENVGDGESNEGDIMFLLDESKIKFEFDSNVVTDKNKAFEVLTPIANFLLEEKNIGITLLLVGCTSGDKDNRYSRELSLSRANAVKEKLMALNVKEDRLQTVGVASRNKWHISGLAESDPLSAMNRQVVLVRADSETAIEILANIEP
jgi:outer membrane protein OmpA-like peptidoglycan-associated protein